MPNYLGARAHRVDIVCHDDMWRGGEEVLPKGRGNECSWQLCEERG